MRKVFRPIAVVTRIYLAIAERKSGTEIVGESGMGDDKIGKGTVGIESLGTQEAS